MVKILSAYPIAHTAATTRDKLVRFFMMRLRIAGSAVPERGYDELAAQIPRNPIIRIAPPSETKRPASSPSGISSSHINRLDIRWRQRPRAWIRRRLTRGSADQNVRPVAADQNIIAITA